MAGFLKQIQTSSIYHWVIWSILIFFKLLIDYSVYDNFLLFINLKIFSVAIILFYLNYYVVLPFIIDRSSHTIITITVSLVILYIGLIIFNPPFAHHPPFPPKRFPPEGFPPPKFPPGSDLKNFKHQLNFYDIFLSVGIFSMIFSTLLFFVDKWIENNKRITALEFERQASELKILREQINPHFFFNALNSIYSLSIKQAKETPGVVLILSDIMRYVLNTKNVHKNNLNDEITNIKKYIEIQSIRFSRFKNINCSFTGDFNAHEIEPLLLLTFVENAFKYANLRMGPLDLSVYVENKTLHFIVNNFYDKKQIERSSECKIGIENTQKKLDLLYPGKHRLFIQDKESEYKLTLELQLS